MKKSKLDSNPITLACNRCKCVWDGRLFRECITCGKAGIEYLSDTYWKEYYRGVKNGTL